MLLIWYIFYRKEIIYPYGEIGQAINLNLKDIELQRKTIEVTLTKAI